MSTPNMKLSLYRMIPSVFHVAVSGRAVGCNTVIKVGNSDP